MKIIFPRLLSISALPFLVFFFLSGKISAQSKKSGTAPKNTQQNPRTKKAENPVDSSKAQNYYLEMKANVRHSKLDEKDPTVMIDSALITIFSGDVPYSEFWTNKKGKCSFRLPLDEVFRIEVSKKGFVSKFFEVNTKVPTENKDEFSFYFDIDIFEEVAGLDVSVLKKPIAKVAYNASVGGFAYDVVYTSRINLDIRKMYKNYYFLQKDVVDTTGAGKTPPHK